MAKFGEISEDPTPPSTVRVFESKTDVFVPRGSPSSTSSSPQPQLSEAAQLARIELEKAQWEKESAKQEEHWMKSYWRPAMGWLYMIICFVDFVAFPVIAMFMPAFIKGIQYIPWKSITLDNGGLIHLAFGAILGITSWTRGQEKVADKK